MTYTNYPTVNHAGVVIRDDDGSTYMTARSYSQIFDVPYVDVLKRVGAANKKSLIIEPVITGDHIIEQRLVPEEIFNEWLKMDKFWLYEKCFYGDGIRAYLHNMVGYVTTT